MGTRVAIIGGSQAGRDHFPYAIADLGAAAKGQGTSRPFALALDQMMKWYYRVSRWKVEIEGSYRSIVVSPASTTTHSFYLDFDWAFTRDVSTDPEDGFVPETFEEWYFPQAPYDGWPTAIITGNIYNLAGDTFTTFRMWTRT